MLLIDDLLATGGTIEANIELVEKLGGKVVGLGFMIELGYLEGRKVIGNKYDVFSLITLSQPKAKKSKLGKEAQLPQSTSFPFSQRKM